MSKKNLKKMLSLLVALVMCFGLAACGAEEEEVAIEPVDLMMGTSGATGSWYPVGVGMSTFWNEDLAEDGIHVYVQTTGGGSENVQMMLNGELDMCTLGSITADEAYNGLNDTPKLENLRAMFALQATSMQPVILTKYAKTGTFSDIEGLKFGVGNPGGNAEKLFNLENEAFGTLNVNVERLSPANACDAIKNGTLDGNFFTGGAPISSIIDLMATPGLDVTLLGVTQEDVDRMNENKDMWTYAELEPGTYEGQTEPIGVAQCFDMVVVTAEVQDEVVYKLLEDMFANIDDVNAINTSMSYFTMDRAVSGVPIPFHPGAVKFFQDHGYEIPEELIPADMK